uniref:Uncharacterized protein n=1 Tax=Arion vulgaris TaxID=1028688 RepID=A0A0B6YAP7_9EUPU
MAVQIPMSTAQSTKLNMDTLVSSMCIKVNGNVDHQAHHYRFQSSPGPGVSYLKSSK